MRRRQWAGLVAAVAVLACGPTANGEPRRDAVVRGPSVLVLVVPGLRADDLARSNVAPLRAVARLGAVGWMNVRSAMTPSRAGDPEASVYLTIGSGTRAVCDRTLSWPRSGRLAAIEPLRAANSGLGHPVPVGGLGEIARDARLRIRVIGESGTNEASGASLLLAMDARGAVDMADPARVASRDAPYGIATDPTRFGPPPPLCLAVWLFGDLRRAEAYDALCTRPMARTHRDRALARLGRLLSERWLPWARDARHGPRQAWLVGAQTDTDPLNRLAPVAVVDDGIGSGAITSPTTRRVGLIAAADVMAAVATFLRVPLPKGAVGRPAQAVGGPLTVERWCQQHARFVAVSRAQAHLGSLAQVRLAMLVALLATAPGALAWVAARGRLTVFRPACARSLRTAIAGGATACIAIQGMSGLMPAEATVGAAWLLGACVSAGYVARSSPAAARLTSVGACGVFCAAVCVGLARHGPLLTDSWLGYSVTEGARYYGVGNETAGALLGTCTPLIQPLLCGRRALAGATILVTFAVLLAWPGGGANLGASVAFALAGGVAASIATRGDRRAAVAASVGAVVVAAVAAAVFLVDRGDGASHLGLAFANADGLGAIALRKAALNARLLVHSPWALCLVASVALLPTARRRLVRAEAASALTVLIVGAAAMLVANDSGVVAAGMALAVGLPALLAANAAEPAQAQRVGHDAD